MNVSVVSWIALLCFWFAGVVSAAKPEMDQTLEQQVEIHVQAPHAGFSEGIPSASTVIKDPADPLSSKNIRRITGSEGRDDWRETRAGRDVLALQAVEASQAVYQRLVDRGKAVLPTVYAALGAVNSPPILKSRLIKLLGHLGGASAVEPIVSAARNNPDNRQIVQAAFVELEHLPDSRFATDYANQVLASPLNPAWKKRAALFYFAHNKDVAARKWVLQYRSPGIDPEIRYAGLYLGTLLGDPSSVQWSMKLLAQGQDPIAEYYLLLGLLDQLEADEFQQLIQGFVLNTENRSSVLRLLRFSAADASGKSEIAAIMLQSAYPGEKKIAEKYFAAEGVDSGHVQTLGDEQASEKTSRPLEDESQQFVSATNLWWVGAVFVFVVFGGLLMIMFRGSLFSRVR